MRIIRPVSILGIVALLLTAVVIPASADGGQIREFHQSELVTAKWVPAEIIVGFKGDVEPFRVVRVPEGQVPEKVEEYLKRPDVHYAEPNYFAYALWEPTDPYYSLQWHLDNPEYGGIQMEEAWGVEMGSAEVVVAVVDTGVAYEDYRKGWRRYYLAPDLAGTTFVAGRDFVENDTHPNDDNSHGTHVTGTIAQSTDNGLGVAGVAFNTAIMPVKVLDRNGSGTYADVAEGIIWAADHGADIINLSLGGPSPSQALEDAVKYAYEHGVTVIAAAGNDGSSEVSYPAAYDNYVIAVGATRYDETLAYYSNYGASLDLVAPGGDISVDQNGDGYGDGVLQNTFNPNTQNTGDFGYWFFQGTSMAAPHVSGVAALLLANGNAGTPDEVRTALQETAEDLGGPGWDDTYGWGLVDAYAALQWTAGPIDSPPTVSITSPPDGATVSGVVTIDANASDDEGVTKVDFYCGTDLIGSDSSVPYSIDWDSTAVVDGDYTLTATAIDTASQDTSDSITVTVDNINDPPVASFIYTTNGLTVSFDASDSYDFDGDIASYSWNFGDGSTGSGVVVEHTYSSADIYSVTLTVTDDDSATDSTSESVTVSEAASSMHVADLDGSVDLKGKSGRWEVFVTVSIHDESGNPVAGATVTADWSGAITGTVSGTTASNGIVTFSTGNMGGGSSVIFTVTDVAHTTLTYDAAANEDPDGDSDGTSIEVIK